MGVINQPQGHKVTHTIHTAWHTLAHRFSPVREGPGKGKVLGKKAEVWVGV